MTMTDPRHAGPLPSPAFGIFHRGVVVVDRTGADDDQQAVVGAVQDAVDGLAGGIGRLRRAIRHRILAEDVGRRHQFLDFPDAQVVGVRLVLRRHGLPHSKIAGNDAARLLREELGKPGYACSTIALGTATDAYQPFERQAKLTRAVLEVLLETRHPVSVVTKSSLVVRDIDLWSELARLNLAQVAISLTTLNGPLARQLEPRASAPHARLEAMAKLAAAGVPVSVFVAPLIPGINDHELEKLLASAREHGAGSASYTLLRLPHEVAGLFREWLDWHAPEKAARVMSVLYDLRGQRANDARFGSRMTGLGHFAELLRQRFDLACRRCGLSQALPRLDSSQFTPPRRADANEDRQLSLF
jgi:DNA repair photolyase